MYINSLPNRAQGILPSTRPQPAGSAPAHFTAALQEAEAGRSLHGPDGSLKPLFRHSTNGMITLNDLQAELADVMAVFQDRFQAALKSAGIDTSRPIALQADPLRNARPRVTNDHPDKARIESLFDQDPGLANEFHHVSALSEHLRAGQEASDFQHAYRANPDAAIARYSDLFSSQYVTTLLLEEGTLGVTTERSPA